MLFSVGVGSSVRWGVPFQTKTKTKVKYFFRKISKNSHGTKRSLGAKSSRVSRPSHCQMWGWRLRGEVQYPGHLEIFVSVLTGTMAQKKESRTIKGKSSLKRIITGPNVVGSASQLQYESAAF